MKVEEIKAESLNTKQFIKQKIAEGLALFTLRFIEGSLSKGLP
jgi:hypothetical protein